MWKRIEIEGEIYFAECKIVKKMVKFILYNLKQSWCEYIELSKVLQRAKDLNKRIQFDELTVQATLLAADSEDAQFECSISDEPVLKLKYRINSLPFHYKWQLKVQSEQEFREVFTIPLFMAVHGMCQQIEELRDVISKKDMELKQYKSEGAILRRTTVATPAFNFAQFDEKFADINKITKGFQKVAENIMEQIKTEEINANEVQEDRNLVNGTNKETTEIPQIIPSEKTKASPRSKKRKNLDMHQKRMVMKLKSRKQKLEYESSQSQTLSESSPDLDIISQELVAIQNSLRDLEKQRIADLNNRAENSISF